MAGLVPAIHAFLFAKAKTWMPGIKPSMTRRYPVGFCKNATAPSAAATPVAKQACSR